MMRVYWNTSQMLECGTYPNTLLRAGGALAALGAVSRMRVSLTETKVRVEDACGVFCYAIWDIAEDARGAWLSASCRAASGDASDAQSAWVQPMGRRVLRAGIHAASPGLGVTDGTSRELRREERVGEKWGPVWRGEGAHSQSEGENEVR